jgi:aminomethyltransferase
MQKIPLHDLHVALGGKIVPFAGFEMPVRYSSDKDEHMAVREDVGVFDVSHMGEFIVKGENALDLLQLVCSNDISKISIGQAQYGYLPNATGGIVDDLIVYRLDEQEYMVVVNASNIQKDWDWISSHNSMGAIMQNISEEIVLLAVQGPKAKASLQKITPIDLDSIPYYHFKNGVLAGKEMIISSTGYTGAGGFELYINKADALGVWEAIFEAGKEFNIKPIGLGARDTLRLEMGYCLYGNDIDDNTSPFEAGLGWVTKFTKNFVNSEFLKKQKEEGVEKKLVGFQMIDKGIARHEYPITTADGTEIGIVTSGSISPVTNIGIGLGYVKTGFHELGTEIYITVRNKSLKAVVTKPPFI